MEILTLPLATALVAGFSHALEADHMAAVTAFVSRRPHPIRALGFGVRWAVGHSLAILAVGGLLIALDLRLPEGWVRGLELGVGAMLLGLGLWAVAGVLHRRSYSTAHGAAHERQHPHSHLRAPRSGTTWVGMAHGLAGTAGFLALLPAAFIASPWLAAGYLALFGLGTVVAMGLYALAAGVLFHRAGAFAPTLGGALRATAALASAAVGALWVWSAVAG